MKEIKVTSNLLIQAFKDSGITEDVYDIFQNKYEYYGTIEYKNGTVTVFNKNKEIDEKTKAFLITGILTGLFTIQKRIKIEKFYYFDEDFQFVSTSNQHVKKEDIEKLKKIKNYFPADKYESCKLIARIRQHVKNNRINLLNTFDYEMFDK